MLTGRSIGEKDAQTITRASPQLLDLTRHVALITDQEITRRMALLLLALAFTRPPHALRASPCVMAQPVITDAPDAAGQTIVALV